tara:strand:- start:87 stop:566 length:480 start_codon:yes stop_codon:yes gene_type:complete
VLDVVVLLIIRRLRLGSYRNKRGLLGAQDTIISILIIIILIISSTLFFVLSEHKKRSIITPTTDNTDQFLIDFLASKYTVDGQTLTGEELVTLTSNGLDPKHLEQISNQALTSVCKNKCYGEFYVNNGLITTVGTGQFENVVSANINLQPDIEVIFYVA